MTPGTPSTDPPRLQVGDSVVIDAGLYCGQRGEITHREITHRRWGGAEWEYNVQMRDGEHILKWENELK